MLRKKCNMLVPIRAGAGAWRCPIGTWRYHGVVAIALEYNKFNTMLYLYFHHWYCFFSLPPQDTPLTQPATPVDTTTYSTLNTLSLQPTTPGATKLTNVITGNQLREPTSYTWIIRLTKQHGYHKIKHHLRKVLSEVLNVNQYIRLSSCNK